MIDIHSPTWEVVSKVCEDAVASSRKSLEAHGASIADTEYQRGWIAACNAVLDLAKPKQPKRLPTEVGSIQY